MTEKANLNEAKYVFAGIFYYLDRILLNITVALTIYILHMFFVHSIFPVVITAVAIISLLSWITVVSTQRSWFGKELGNELLRITILEEAVYGQTIN